MIVLTILAALIGAIAGFAGAGFGAAVVLVSALGGRDGGPAMAGFFTFGPIGGFAGALLGSGLMLRFGRRSPKWGTRLMIGAAVVTGLGGILLAVVSMPDRGPSYSYVIGFELEYPTATLAGVEIPGTHAMWGAGGGDAEAKPISQFFEKKCSGDICVLNGSIAVLGDMNNFRVTALIGEKRYSYPLDLPGAVTGPVDWSEWRQGDGARVRWRIVRR